MLTGHQDCFRLWSFHGLSPSWYHSRSPSKYVVQGGHGAVTLYLLYPELFKSASAFAPILNPTECAWGKKAFAGPNGNDGYLKNGIEEGKERDATELVKGLKEGRQLDLLIDYVRIRCCILSFRETDV